MRLGLSYNILVGMTKSRPILSVRLDPAPERDCEQVQTGPTLGSLAEAVLPPLPKGAGRKLRQERFRDYVREKRRR